MKMAARVYCLSVVDYMAAAKAEHILPGVRHLIPKEKTGLDFLLSSHFRVAQSDDPLDKTYYSITTQV